MGKQGPCYHCGITTTPLWRNGPPEKPVLCNACGSRWRTKGTLVNYMPMHSGGCGMMRSDSSDKPFQGKGSKCKEQRSHKRKKPCKVYANIEHGIQRPDLYHSRGLDDDISIRSTGSEISCSEGCTQRIAHGGRNFLVFWSLWDCHIPSKKRTPFCRRQLSSSKLSKLQLLFDGRETSTLGSSEASLLVEYKTPSTAVEIGLGGVFIRPPIPIQEQESVSSSLFFESKEHDYSSSSKQDAWKAKNLPIQFTRGVSKPLFQGEEKMNLERRSMEARCSDSPVHSKQIMKTFLDKRYNPLLTYYSPLILLDLKDIVNFDIFTRFLTRQEQSQLTKLTTLADVSMSEESLKEMFNSSQFEAALANFQLLLSKGMFNFTESGICGRNLPLYLQLLEVTDLTTSGWMEQWSQIANHSKYNYSSGIRSKEYHTKNVQKGRTEERNITNVLQISKMSKNMVEKRFPNRPLGHVMAGESGQNSYALQSLTSPSSVASKTLQSAKVIRKKNTSKDPICLSKNRSCITADSLYLSTSNKDHSEPYNSMSALMNDLAESDLLLDVPSSMSFQQAELLPQSVWSRNQPANIIEQDCNASLTGSMPVANILQKEKSPD